MIISHKFRFIFLKTHKVGGTSLEIALSQFLGDDDVITPISAADEAIRTRLGYRGPQNHLLAFGELRPWDLPRLLKGVARKGFSSEAWPRKYWNHIKAGQVRSRVGPSVWSSYFKFSIERNPWDLAVSRYYWEKKRNRNRGLEFEDFVLNGMVRSQNFKVYSIRGKPAVDKIVRYENFEAELEEVAREIGLGGALLETLSSIKAKSGFRKPGTYRDLYTEASRRKIAERFHREIALFGYEF